jgi:hypothetical protein
LKEDDPDIQNRGYMAKKQAKVIKLAEFREAQQADDGIRALEDESGSNSRSEALLRKPRKSGQQLGHWTFKGWTAPSPFLAGMMRSPITAPPMQRGTAMLESGALAYRRRENGELEILLVSKKRSKRWGIPTARTMSFRRYGGNAIPQRCHRAVMRPTHYLPHLPTAVTPACGAD